MDVGYAAFMWGIVSAVSLPLGAGLGLAWKPGSKINSAFMAFGAGALLFALSVELFGHVPHYVREHGLSALAATCLGALLGGFLFDLLNQILNNKGAFLRSLSNAKNYVAKKKILRAHQLINNLSQIEVLQQLPPKQMAQLVQKVKKRKYAKGSHIFQQGAFADEMFFIASGTIKILHHDNHGEQKQLALLGAHDTFGEMGLLSGNPRTADAIATEETIVYVLEKHDLEEFLVRSPELRGNLERLANSRIDDLSLKDREFANEDWKNKSFDSLRRANMPVSREDIRLESEQASQKNAAFAIWLGILIDGIPESLVIGMLALEPTGMSLAFVAGVFLANLPESMSSAVTMRSNGVAIRKILLMWGSLCFLTGVGAVLGAWLFPANPVGDTFYLVLGIEGLAAGAMLTMIAETMLPEAFEQGGAIVGLSTLCGFLAALSVKVF